MKIRAYMVSICLTLFLSSGGCSKKEEEQVPAPEQTIKVVRPIEKPSSEVAPITPEAQKRKQEQEVKKGEETKVVAVEEKAPIASKHVTKEIETVLGEVGYYVVKDGDSLTSIAAREDVYGDPLKWPILYRLNLMKLRNMPLGEDFPDRHLDEGLTLKIVTPEEGKENLKKRANNLWIVNVQSSTAKDKIIPPAVRLILNGYPVYITRAKVKGKDYMRLRVGFFGSRSEADSEGKKITAVLKLKDTWTNKIGPNEFEEFAKY